MADHAASSAGSVISPKVIAGFLSSGGAVVLVAILTAITPDMLDFLGGWKAVAIAGITALAGALGGYIKRDPLRETTPTGE